MTRLEGALAAIDRANADDPHVVVIDGQERPKELTHAAMVMGWVEVLDPSADDAQLLAARAHHLRRWELPRSTYPDGRSGYLRWRTEQKKRHAVAVESILATAGYDRRTIERVQQIIRKEALGSDPDVQVHEDALCLVFLQTQLDELIDRLGPDRSVGVLGKTVAKMSAAALERVAALELSEQGRAAVSLALD